MSNSGLISFKSLTPQHYSYGRDGMKISKITIHHAAGNITLEALAANARTRQCSYNYCIDNVGRIGLIVEEMNRAWTSSNSANDRIAVTIEVANSKSGGDWPVSAAAYGALLCLCEDICRRNDLSQLTYIPSNHSASMLTMHKWFDATACPGPYLEARFPQIARTVSQRLKTPGGSKELNAYAQQISGKNWQAATAAAIASSGNTLGGLSSGDMYDVPAEELINTDILNPYIITLDESSPTTLNWDLVKKKHISGVMIESGRYYSSILHSPASITGYRNKKLRDQLISTLKAGIPFGLVHPITARNREECDGELDALRQVVRLYPPVLGVWLRLESGAKSAMLDLILDKYYDFLSKHVGLGNSLGIQTTKSQLKQIAWEKKHSQHYLLWTIDRLDSVSNLTNLLTPAFFNVVGN